MVIVVFEEIIPLYPEYRDRISTKQEAYYLSYVKDVSSDLPAVMLLSLFELGEMYYEIKS